MLRIPKYKSSLYVGTNKDHPRCMASKMVFTRGVRCTSEPTSKGITSMGYPAVAQHYLEAGWEGVIPLPPRSKVPPPAGYTGRGAPMPTPEKIFEWIEKQAPNANIGIRLPDGVIGIDVDTGYEKNGQPKTGLESFQHLIDTHGPIEDTWMSTSRLTGEGIGSGIRFYRVPTGLKWRESGAGKDIDIISHTHRFAVVWPSKHPQTGQTYRWVKPDGEIAHNEFPALSDLPALPEKWVKALTEEDKPKSAEDLPPATTEELEKLWQRVDRLAFHSEDIENGRNNELSYLAWRLGQLIPNGLVDELTVRDKLWDAAQACGLVAEDSEYKCRATIDGGVKKGIADPRRVRKNHKRECTDVGNAERLADRECDRIRYVREWGKWMHWDGTVWRSDYDSVYSAAIDTVRSMPAELGNAGTDAERSELFKWYKVSQSEAKLRAMLTVAQSHRTLRARSSEFDAQTTHINCANGIVDLRTGELSPHTSSAMHSQITPYNYNPDAQCPQFLNFLKRIFDGDQELIDYVQRMFGYTLTGLVTEQKMFVLWGGGANGKSTLIDVVHGVCGQYAKVGDPNMLLATMNERHSVEVAVLKDARFVSLNETDANRSLAEARVKALAGGDSITARFMYGNTFEFKPKFKIWLASNHRPRVRGNDDGIWRRLILIPFNVQIPPHERVQGLADTLLYEEGEGIFAWAVAGAKAWFEEGWLKEPLKITQATSEYRDTEDTFSQFIDAAFVRDLSAYVRSAEARGAYNDWAVLNGERKLSSQEFKRLMEEHGIEAGRNNKGSIFKSVRLRMAGDNF